MTRAKLIALGAALLLAGFVAGRVSDSGSGPTVTVQDTVTRSIVVAAQHVRSASDPRDPGPLDLAEVDSVRHGVTLVTTIVARNRWDDSLIRTGRARLSIEYDGNRDGEADRRDVLYVFHGRLAAWISSFKQGVQNAIVTRRSPTTITVARDASVLFNASGQAPLLWSSPIGVAVVASWPGGSDRVPNRGWITVPPPAGP